MPVYTVTHSNRVAQGSSPGVVLRLLTLSGDPARPSCLRPTIIQVLLVGMFVLGLLCLVVLGQMLCLQHLHPGVQRQMTCLEVHNPAIQVAP